MVRVVLKTPCALLACFRVVCQAKKILDWAPQLRREDVFHDDLGPHLTFYTRDAMQRLEDETLLRCMEVLEGRPVLVLSHDPLLRRGPPPIRTLRMAKNYWLVKAEPEAYSWGTFLKEGRTAWTGVRNFQARNNLRAMRKGDLVFFYHSVTEKQVVGLARVEKEFYPDPTATEGDWSAVNLVPVKGLQEPVKLETIKADKILREIPLVRQSRLSVTPLTETQFERILALAGTRL